MAYLEPWYIRNSGIFSSQSTFRTLFHLRMNQVVGFHQQDVWKTLVEEWDFKKTFRSMTWIFT